VPFIFVKIYLLKTKMIKTFLEAEKYLYKLIPNSKTEKYPGRLGLLRMFDLLQRLGNPQNQFTSIHIAGTAGKGSTAYLTAKIMQQAGYKTGLHTSPHLQTVKERIVINGRLISEKDFIAAVNQLRPVIDKMEQQSYYGKPSYFEVLLAAAFLFFKQEKVDLAVIETGMGGRYDGTNVLRPKIAVITNIGLDHTHILGKTKSAILKDKMEIIKPGIFKAVAGIKQNYLLKIIKNHCQKNKAPLLIYNKDFKTENVFLKKNYSQFDYVFKRIKIKKIKLSLPGAYQISNACLAITSCLELSKNTGFNINRLQIKKALSQTFFPGRLETVLKKPLIILDGAHNNDKVKALTASIKKVYPQKKFIIVFAVKKDKDFEKMIKILTAVACQFVITQFNQKTDLGFKLGFDAEKLSNKVKKIIPQEKVIFLKNSYLAFKKAQKLAEKNKQPVLITGSLYLIGEARNFFKLKPNLKI
jgi:dihydrofolate synthase / folylpolyglutamate synthase